MASNKIWFVNVSAGHPSLGREVSSRGPLTEKQAREIYDNLPDDWRKWIDKADGTVLVMNSLEKQWRAGAFE